MPLMAAADGSLLMARYSVIGQVFGLGAAATDPRTEPARASVKEIGAGARIGAERSQGPVEA